MSTLIDAVTDQLDKARDGDGRESIDNSERGCGFLTRQSCYIRSDVTALSAADGEIPRFVALDQPVEYREHTGRGAIIPGWKAFPGNGFAAHYAADGRTTTPPGDIADHFDRLSRYGFDGDHFANITSAKAFDVLLSVGSTHWETPQEYIDECRDRGLNLKIPVSGSSPPPVIEPLRTRVWVIHPHGAGDGRPAIIGYAYATRNVFTTGAEATSDDPDVPGFADDYAATRDDFDIVDPGEPIADDDPAHDRAQRGLSEFEREPSTVEPSNKPGRDVEEVGHTCSFCGGDHPDVTCPDRGENTDEPDDVLIEDVYDYNRLKSIAADTDVDVGATPSRDELIDALRDAVVDTVAQQ